MMERSMSPIRACMYFALNDLIPESMILNRFRRCNVSNPLKTYSCIDCNIKNPSEYIALMFIANNLYRKSTIYKIICISCTKTRLKKRQIRIPKCAHLKYLTEA